MRTGLDYAFWENAPPEIISTALDLLEESENNA